MRLLASRTGETLPRPGTGESGKVARLDPKPLTFNRSVGRGLRSSRFIVPSFRFSWHNVSDRPVLIAFTPSLCPLSRLNRLGRPSVLLPAHPMKTLRILTLLALTALPAYAQNGKPDAEGFIRDWLILAPLAIEGSGAEAIDKKQFADEAQPAAKDGASQSIGSAQLTWKKTTTPAFYIDFKELNPKQSEQVCGWAVAYLVSPDDKSGLTLKMNSNDQGKVYLNGKELVKFTDTRTLEKDAEDSATGVALKKGANVLVLKVVNEENNWQGSVRFMNSAGKPVTDFKVETKP